jgi:hypothetical protein
MTNPEIEVVNMARADEMERALDLGGWPCSAQRPIIRAVEERDGQAVSALFENAPQIHEDGKFRLALGLALLATDAG